MSTILCKRPKFTLGEFQVLNALFNMPKGWTPTTFTTSKEVIIRSQFKSDGSKDGWTTFKCYTDHNGSQELLADLNGNEYIVLKNPGCNYKFTIKKLGEGKIRWYNVHDELKRAFPLIDIKGWDLKDHTEFVVGGYVDKVVCRSTVPFELTVTALMKTSDSTDASKRDEASKVDNLYYIDGDIHISVDGERVKVATKYNTKDSNKLVPEKRFVALAKLLRSINKYLALDIE